MWMKVLLKEKHLNPDNWTYIENEPGKLTLVHRQTYLTREIEIKKEHL